MKVKYDFKGPPLKEILLFELVSFYGRTFQKNKGKIKKITPLLLDVGAGANYRKGWLHVDFYVTPKFKFWKNYNERLVPEIQMDLRYPFLCEDNIVDGIYSGHTLEHLWPFEAKNLLKEFYRILKPGAWLRINVPDIEKFVNYYNGNISDPEFNEYKNGCLAISMITQNYGHHSAWDGKLLKLVLEDIGFVDVKRVLFGVEGQDKRLIKEKDVRRWETVVVEAKKP